MIASMDCLFVMGLGHSAVCAGLLADSCNNYSVRDVLFWEVRLIGSVMV